MNLSVCSKIALTGCGLSARKFSFAFLFSLNFFMASQVAAQAAQPIDWRKMPEIESCEAAYELGGQALQKEGNQIKTLSAEQKMVPGLVVSWFHERPARNQFLARHFSETEVNQIELFLAALRGKKWTIRKRLQELRPTDDFYTAADRVWLRKYAELGLNAPEPKFTGLKMLITFEYYLEKENLPKAKIAYDGLLKYIQKQSLLSENLYGALFSYFLNLTAGKLALEKNENSKNLEKKIQNWHSNLAKALNGCFADNVVITNLPELRQTLGGLKNILNGQFALPGGLGYVFAKENSGHSFHFSLNAKKILSSDQTRNLWYADGKIYNTSRIFAYTPPDQVFFNPDLTINRNESGGNISFNLSPGTNKQPRFAPERFSLFFGEGLYSHRVVKRDNLMYSFVSSYSMTVPLKQNFTILVQKEKTLNALVLYNGITKNALSLSNLDYEIKKENKLNFPAESLQISTPLPMTYYQIALGKIFLSTTTAAEKQAGGDSEYNLHAQLQKSADIIFKGTSKQKIELANAFAAMKEKFGKSPSFYRVVGWLYAQVYDYKTAASYFEELFYFSENENSRSTRSVTLPGLNDEVTYYAWLLSQAGYYQRAGAFLEEYTEKARMAHDHESFMTYAYQLTDIYFRQKKFNSALGLIRESIALTGEKPRLAEKRQFAEAGLAILSFLAKPADLKSFHADLITKGIIQKDAFKEFLPEKEVKSVRLRNLPEFPGEGKNFCVPIALQFVLNYYGDTRTTQKEIAAEIGTGENGSDFHGFVRYLSKKNFHIVYYSGGFKSTQEYLSRGIPVLTLLEPEGSDIGHATVIIGADDGTKNYYMYEPGNKFALHTMTAKELENRQQTSGRLYFAIMKSDSAKSEIDDVETKMAVTYYDQISSRNVREAFVTLKQAMEKVGANSVHATFFRTQWLKTASAMQHYAEKPEDTLKKYANTVTTATEFFLLGEIANKAGLDPHMYYEKAIQSDTRNPYASIRLAESYSRKRDFARAKKYFLESLHNARLFSNYANLEKYIYNVLGSIAVQENDFTTAVKYLLVVTPAENLAETLEKERALIEKSPDKHLPEFLKRFILN